MAPLWLGQMVVLFVTVFKDLPQTGFLNGFTDLHWHQQQARVPSPHPRELLLFIFLTILDAHHSDLGWGDGMNLKVVLSCSAMVGRGR